MQLAPRNGDCTSSRVKGDHPVALHQNKGELYQEIKRDFD